MEGLCRLAPTPGLGEHQRCQPGRTADGTEGNPAIHESAMRAGRQSGVAGG